MVVLPDWLDHAPALDFSPEKNLLALFEAWAREKGWIVSDGSSLPIELRQRTDVLLEQPHLERRIRLTILHKSKRGTGVIRLDASNLRTFELVHQRRQQRWRVVIGGTPIEDDLLKRGWDWLIDLMFRP